MDLRKRISYQWQMFILMVAAVWLLIFGMAYWQYDNERQYRKQLIDNQLNVISDRIIYAYMRNTEIRPFIEFIGNYFVNNDKSNSIFDKLRVSVYENGRLIQSVGDVVHLSAKETARGSGYTNTPNLEENSDEILKDGAFYYQATTNHVRGNELTIYTVLPVDDDVNNATLPNKSIWIIVFCVALAMTVGAYYLSRYFGRNIKILRLFAERAATDPNFIPNMDYPHDELGEISRQIIHMYNERSKTLLKLKREHKVALHAMEEKARLKRQLTNNITHELKTPIGVIKGYLDTIIENPDMEASSREHFQLKAREHINRLVNLITDVSAITRLEEGAGMISTEEMDYHDVVYNIASDVEESGAAGNLEFSYDVPLDCMVVGNYNLLSGMLINLVKNASSYSKGTECGVKLLREDEKFYYFSFYDNGIGVGEEHIPHLFERFYRVDSGRSRKAGGTGLGLPIVQSTILAHGGSIEIHNREGGGLEFVYSLPKTRPE